MWSGPEVIFQIESLCLDTPLTKESVVKKGKAQTISHSLTPLARLSINDTGQPVVATRFATGWFNPTQPFKKRPCPVQRTTSRSRLPVNDWCRS